MDDSNISTSINSTETNQTIINVGEDKSLFERAIIEAYKQKQSKNIYEKLSIALDEIKFMVDDIKRSKKFSSQSVIDPKGAKNYLLNKNIIDKISRIVERRFFNVNILIARIFENLLDPNNFAILSGDVNLLINFSNEVLNLLENIKSTIVSRQLEKKCSAFLNYLSNLEGINDEQKSIITELLSGFPTRNSSEVYKTFDQFKDKLLKLCRNQSLEDKLEGINQMMESFGNTASLEEQFDLLIEKVPAIVKAIIHQPNPEYKEAYFQLGNFICSILYATKFKVDAYLPDYRINSKDFNKNYFYLIAGDQLVDETSKYEISFLHNTIYELTTQKEILMKCENIFQICNLILNTLSIYENIFDLQFVNYIILKRIYFTFPQFKRNIEDLLAVTLVNLCSFTGQFEVENSEECRIFLNYLLKYGDEDLKHKINKRLETRNNVKIETKIELEEKELNEVEFEYLKLADFNLRIGYPSSQEIEAGSEMSKYIEVHHPNSMIYVGFATHSNDITFHLLKYIPNDEIEGESRVKQQDDDEDTDSEDGKIQKDLEEDYTDKGHFKLLLKLDRIDSSLTPVKIVMFVPEPGTYKLIFDNTFSWFTGKTLRYRLSVLKPLSEVDLSRRVDFDKLRRKERLGSNKSRGDSDQDKSQPDPHENKILMVKLEGVNRAFSVGKIYQSQQAIADTSKYRNIPVLLTKDSMRIFRTYTNEYGVDVDEYKEIPFTKQTLDNEVEDNRSLPEIFEEELCAYILNIPDYQSKSIFLNCFLMEKSLPDSSSISIPITNDEYVKSVYAKLGFYPERLLTKFENLRFFTSSMADSLLLHLLFEKILNEEKFNNIIHIHFDKYKCQSSLYFEGVINDKISGLNYDHSKSLLENVDNVIDFVNKVIVIFGAFDLSISYSDFDDK
jgi:hypothetical protein